MRAWLSGLKHSGRDKPEAPERDAGSVTASTRSAGRVLSIATRRGFKSLRTHKLRHSWRGRLMIARAQFLLWWRLPLIKNAPRHLDTTAIDEARLEQLKHDVSVPVETYGVPIAGSLYFRQAMPSKIPTGNGEFPTVLKPGWEKAFYESDTTNS